MTNDPVADCLFCRIVAGEIPVEVVAESDATLAIKDIEPQAPTHVLVVPKAHHVDITALSNDDPELAGRLVVEATKVATQLGLDEYRLVFNTGATAGQTVFHVHAHILGGRPMLWPPG
jgi:histidine triad (HIT) family protein